MTDETPQAYFKSILVTALGQAFSAAGYHLQDRPVKHAGGLFRFVKAFADGDYGIIEFQLLAYADTEWAPRMPSRFRVTLIRSQKGAEVKRRDLGTLVTQDFGVAILPSDDYWWPFSNLDELGRALGEAGHLAVGYGMPWLAGDLQPPSGG